MLLHLLTHYFTTDFFLLAASLSPMKLVEINLDVLHKIISRQCIKFNCLAHNSVNSIVSDQREGLERA